MYDLLIRNGTVVDGSGLARYRADVAVKDGRIAAIGRIRDGARQVVDAEGHVVTPGFIDGHTHLDAQMFWDPLGASSCWNGVTTTVMGNCGFTLAPASKDQRHLVVRNLERAEDISGTAMEAGIEWRWSTFREYLDVVDKLPKGINYTANIGHSALRTWVMGEAAFERAATEDELRKMEAELTDALRAGAVGLSTSRSQAHNTSDDRPVASRLADWSELQRLVGVMARDELGMLEIAFPTTARGPDPQVRRAFQDALANLAIDSGVTTTFGVQAHVGREECGMVERVNAAGGRMFCQSHSRGIHLVLSFKTTTPYDWVPEWQSIRALPYADQVKALRDPAVRGKLVAAAKSAVFPKREGADAARKPDFSTLIVMNSAVPPNPSLADIAAQRGCDPVEAFIDLAAESELNQMFMQPNRARSSDELLYAMKHPNAVMTFSDSGAHVTQIMDSSIQTHLLAYWVRQRQEFTLEEGVRMITLAPAVAWKFTDRGLLRPGAIADINVFNPDTIAPQLPVLKSDLPTGARRLEQKADGILATVVAGEVFLRNGEHTGALPGRLLRMQR